MSAVLPRADMRADIDLCREGPRGDITHERVGGPVTDGSLRRLFAFSAVEVAEARQAGGARGVRLDDHLQARPGNRRWLSHCLVGGLQALSKARRERMER